MHKRRVQVLRSLSMTCGTMRLRLLPWVWERLWMPPPYGRDTQATFGGILSSFEGASRASTFLAPSVRYLCALLYVLGSVLINVLQRFMKLHLDRFALPLFVECLQSLPNLYTLEVGWVQSFTAALLENALKGVELPQIKTLVVPPPAYPLLQHCCNVEDIVCVASDQYMSPDRFLGSLTSNQDSKVKRLAIPLVTWANPSRKRSSTVESRDENDD